MLERGSTDVAARLRQWLKENSISIKDFSQRMGVKEQYMNMYLKEDKPSLFGAPMLAKMSLLGVDIDWLLTGVKSQQSSVETATFGNYGGYKNDDNVVTIPLYRPRVNAGRGVPVYGGSVTSIQVIKSMVRDPRNTFAVEVSGESMNGDGIFDGDTIIVERTDNELDAHLNKIVVVTMDGVTLLKRLKAEKGRYSLASSNPQFNDIPLTMESNCVIEGTVRNVIREVW